jgi:hypothetical protein
MSVILTKILSIPSIFGKIRMGMNGRFSFIYWCGKRRIHMADQRKNKRTTNAQPESGDRVSQGSIFQAGRDIQAGRDLAGRDIAGRDIAGRDILSQDSSQGLKEFLIEWQSQMEAKIESKADLSTDEKKDLKEQVTKIQEEATKGKQTDPNRLEKLINMLGVMAPDIFEVAVATLTNPLAGVGLVLKKIGDKARLESQAG